MTGESAFEQLGVRSDVLRDEECRSLDEDGYVVLEGVLDAEQVDRARRRIEGVVEDDRREAETPGGLRRQAEARLDWLDKVIGEFDGQPEEEKARAQATFKEHIDRRRGPARGLRQALAGDDRDALRKALDDAGGSVKGEFGTLGETDLIELPLNAPRVLAAVTHLLGADVQAGGMLCRAPKVGDPGQSLHRDSRDPTKPLSSCNALWLIDDMNVENGATRVVPGSHLTYEPWEELDPTVAHPDEIPLEGKAGDVIVFGSRLLHAGSARTGGGPRRVLITGFTKRADVQRPPLPLDDSVRARLNPAQRWLLGLEETEAPSDDRAPAGVSR
jgi:ectoine hydroxylase-related dioxygenase (phytanoyl-CoA dioxygenase family)